MTTITPGLMLALPSDKREGIRMWMLNALALDPSIVTQLEFTEVDDEPVIEVTYVGYEKDDEKKETLVELTVTRPLTSPLPWDLDTFPEAADTSLTSLDPDEISDNPTGGRPSDVAKTPDDDN